MSLGARLDRIIARARRWMPGSRADRDIQAELQAFVDLLTREKVAAGMSATDARRQALREAGGLQQTAEAVRDLRPSAWLERLGQDARYGLRILYRAPGLSAAVILTLALGIGATSATFSVVDNVLLKPLGYAEADRLVVILHDENGPVSTANFLDWQRHARGFSAMAAAEYWTPNLGGVREPERLFALHVTNELLPLLGVPPLLGRFPAVGPAGLHEAVIGHALWQRTFGGRPDVVGHAVTLDGESYDIVGVMPADFRFAPFWATRAELWAPLDLAPRARSRGGRSLRVFARLAPGTTIEQARASVASVTAALEAEFPGTNRLVTVTLLKEKVVGATRQAIVALFSAVLLVLLIACANVAHLLLVRASSREREVAMRAALGAPRRRLVRQFLVESLMLSAAGGVGGLILASGGIHLVRLLGATSIPRVQAVVLDQRVFVFTAALCLLTAVLFGLAPAVRFSRPDLTTPLRSSERGGTASRRARRLRGLLIASEVALAVVLLVGAALLLRSFATLRSVETGWNSKGVASIVVSAIGSADHAPERRAGLYTRVLERLQTLPGIAAASAINHLPMAGDHWGINFAVEGRPEPAPGQAPAATYRAVMPAYFATMGLPMARGREFTAQDRIGAPDVIIVNEFLANRHWPGEDALGKRMHAGTDANGLQRTVVGIARNAVRARLREDTREEMYLPLLQDRDFLAGAGNGSGYVTYVLRATGSAAQMMPAVREAVRSVAPTAAIADVAMMEDVVAAGAIGDRFLLVLVGVFASLALALAAIGIYGVMSYTVSMRQREMGIRLALGAAPGRIVTRIVLDGLVVTFAGAAVGAGLAVLAGRSMSQLLFRVDAFDMPAFVVAVATLLTTAMLACYLPARRASRIDPQRELR